MSVFDCNINSRVRTIRFNQRNTLNAEIYIFITEYWLDRNIKRWTHPNVVELMRLDNPTLTDIKISRRDFKNYYWLYTAL